MDRFDHCTHPTLTVCDCDWCRYLRSGQISEALQDRAQDTKRRRRNARSRAAYQARRDLGLTKTPYGWE